MFIVSEAWWCVSYDYAQAVVNGLAVHVLRELNVFLKITRNVECHGVNLNINGDTWGLGYLGKSTLKPLFVNMDFLNKKAFDLLAAVLPANQMPGLKTSVN